jgi:hypothetical protein
MRANLTLWTTLHLCVVQVWIHLSAVIQEPCLDITHNSVSIANVSVQREGQGIVQDRVSKSFEVAYVIDQAIVGVQLTILLDVVTLLPNLIITPMSRSDNTDKQALTLLFSEHGGVLDVGAIWPPAERSH